MDTFTLVIFIVLLIITTGLVIACLACIVWMGVILFEMFSTADHIRRQQQLKDIQARTQAIDKKHNQQDGGY